MAWIKKENDVEVSNELEGISKISVTNAYEVEITGCRLSESKQEGSKSLSLVVDVMNDAKEVNTTYFTILGKDGETYFSTTYQGKTVKKEHFGLSIANTMFKIVLDKEIFDVEPSEVEFKEWNNESKEFKDAKGDGFPELIGKRIGVCVQMTREISGADSKEYGTIEHFFDCDTGLFAGEDENTPKRKLDKWLGSAKDFKIVEKEARNKSSFGGKKSEETPKKSGWGR